MIVNLYLWESKSYVFNFKRDFKRLTWEGVDITKEVIIVINDRSLDISDAF